MENKNYNCKNEELPVIAEYLVFSLKKDLADFTAFSPKFNEMYVTAFEGKIDAVKSILNPRDETVELKNVTARLYVAMDALIAPIARIERYVKMAGSAISVSVKDFGLPELRRKIRSRDAEGVLATLKTVNGYIDTYKSTLAAQGMPDDLIALFANAVALIHDNNQRQYEIIVGRKKLVDNNMHLFKELYSVITDVCDTGKVVYRSNSVATKEYIFTELKKRVRVVHKPQPEKPASEKEE
jgi:hypothetical protein